MMLKRFILLVSISLFTSCATMDGPPDSSEFNPENIRKVIPANEPLSRYGNPDEYEVMGKTYQVLKSSRGFVQRGDASWYGTKFHGKRTSSGEPYDMYAMTAAHKRLPLPTYVEVTNLNNNRKIVVKVNDRGPFHPGRIIDLSYAAAHKLGITGTGTAPVEIRAIDTSGLDLNTASVILPDSANGNGKIHVQVAAMGTESAAETMATSLREQNFQSVRVHVVNDDGKKLYRVRIGPIPDVDLAYRVLKDLNNIGLASARVVVD